MIRPSPLIWTLASAVAGIATGLAWALTGTSTGQSATVGLATFLAG